MCVYAAKPCVLGKVQSEGHPRRKGERLAGRIRETVRGCGHKDGPLPVFSSSQGPRGKKIAENGGTK